MAVSLRTVAGVVMLTALAMAPLNFGSTRPLPLHTLIALTGTGGAMWLLSCALRRGIELPSWLVSLGAVLVGVSGVAWWFFLRQPDVPDFTREHFARIVARWPYSVVPRDLPVTMAWAASSVIALFALADLAREPAWRQAICAVILVTGTVVALIGLLQNAFSARGIYWDSSHRLPGAFFGTFFHHTAAGAYLNTAWPVGIALALESIQTGPGGARRHWPVCGALLCALLILAAHAGHISRFPQVIALAALVVFAVWTRLWRQLGEFRGLRLAVCAMGVVVLAGTVYVGATRLGTIASRWNQLVAPPTAASAVAPVPMADWTKAMRDDLFIPSDHRSYVLGDRGAAYAAALAAIKDRPWFGWGPGGWMAAAAAHSNDAFVRTFYLMLQFTHSDLLQTCVEWGLVGAAGWMLLVPGAAVHGLVRLRLRPARDYLGAGAVTALGAVLVQSLLDFPLQIPAVQWNVTALAALAWSVPGAPSNEF